MKFLFYMIIMLSVLGCQTSPPTVPVKRPDVLQCRAVCGLNGVIEVNILADDSQSNLNCKCK